MAYLICPDCGETHKFHREAWGTTHYTETHILDYEENVEDYEDYDTGDSEEMGHDPASCSNCEAEALGFETFPEYIDWVCKHFTDCPFEKSDFCKEGHETDQELKKQLEAKYLAEQIGGKQ